MKIFFGIIFLLVFIALIAGGELLSQVARYQVYWNRRNQQPAQANELLYVALGDSTAQGIGASKPQKGYAGLIADDLAKQSGRPVRTLNFSKTGATLFDALDRQLPLLKKTNLPKDTIVTIEIGANDMGTFNSEKFKRQMDELMSELPNQTVISDIPYFGGGLHRRLEPNVEQANEIIHRLAKQHNLKLANLHQRTLTTNQRRDYAVDRFHPSNYKYKTGWVPAFMEQIEL